MREIKLILSRSLSWPRPLGRNLALRNYRLLLPQWRRRTPAKLIPHRPSAQFAHLFSLSGMANRGMPSCQIYQ
jgi:hypothetical protein